MTAPLAPARLPRIDKILYATAGIGNNALFWAQSFWILTFYGGLGSAPERVSVGVIGVALGIGKFIELFDDPVIGWWSDRTRSRWGRRIPFILLGTPVLGISFYLLWSPPPPEAGWVNLLWFFVTIEAFFLARTVVEAPYEALQAEITSSSTERVSLGAWKLAIGIIGVILGMVVSPLLIEWFGYGGMGLILAVIAVIAVYVMLFGLWRRGTLNTGDPPVERPPLFGSLLGALRNRSFLALCLSFMLFGLGYQLLSKMLAPFVTRVLGLSEGAASIFTGGVVLFALLSLPALARLTRRFTKRTLYAGAMLVLGSYLLVVTVGIFIPLLPGVTFFAQAAALISFSGLGFGAMWVFPSAMVADVIDEDSRQTSQGRAAIFFGMFKTVEKFADSAAAILFGIVLTIFGDTAANPLGIQLLMPIAALSILGGFIVVWLGYHMREAPTSEGVLLAEVGA